MKRYLISLLLLSVALSMAGCDGKSRSTSVWTDATEGDCSVWTEGDCPVWTDADGSAAKPYRIYTAGDLYAVRGGLSCYEGWGLDKHYVLMQDIDLCGYASGEGWVPIGTMITGFTGVFDGNGKVISNLTINRPGSDHQALFGGASLGAVIKNVGLSAVNIKAHNRASGLVGYILSSTISNCYATGTVSGNSDVGGLVGCNDHATISNSYTTETVSGGNSVGGLVGYNIGTSATIINSYTTATVSSTGFGGGLAGYNDPLGTISNSYWITDDAALPLVGSGSCTSCAKLTDVQGKQQASYTGWDFVNIWKIEETVSYPELRWQM